LESYSQRKVIFTNADTNHANRVISALGLEGCFDQIVDIRDIHPYCKPQPEAFEMALQLIGIQNRQTCIMFDDAPRNLLTAKSAGLFAVLIGASNCPDRIDAAIPSLLELPTVITPG
jgi:putative hydrolase of the HAD superfamily